MITIPAKQIVNMFLKMKAAGASLDECVVVVDPSQPNCVYVMSDKDFKRNSEAQK